MTDGINEYLDDRSRAFRRMLDMVKMAKLAKPPRPVFIGVDWAAGHGQIRGEVIKTEGNVQHVRFKTVEVDPDGTLR